ILAGTLIAFSAASKSGKRIFYNASESAPRGWYWLTPSISYRTGMRVFAILPGNAVALADKRRYLPRTVPILKPIAAVAGDAVCESTGIVRINGELVARALPRDSQDRPLQAWSGCRALSTEQYFLLSRDSEASFDSRYFGPVTS